MRPYQLEGLSYFSELHSRGLSGGILADEMVSGRSLHLYRCVTICVCACVCVCVLCMCNLVYVF